MGNLAKFLLLSREETSELERFNNNGQPFDDQALVDDLIFAADVIDAEACVCGSRSVVRSELLREADRLATFLQQRGVGRGHLVAIQLSPSIDRLAAVLAVLRAGAAFMPLDPDLPLERLRFCLEDSLATVVIAEAGSPITHAGSQAAILTLPLDPGRTAPCFRDPSRQAEDWAYVIYTSGSTGKPKAAVNSHRALVNRLQWMARSLQVGSSDRVLHKTAFGFDVSIWEQLLPLLVGACVVVAPSTARGDAQALAALIESQAVTIVHFVPTLLSAFAEIPFEQACRSVRAVVCSGETLPKNLALAIAARFNCPIFNYYGPTEAAIDVTWWRFSADDPYPFVPIGRPIQNVQIHVLDQAMQRVPIGVIGDLWIGGVAPGPGYLRRPALTASRFVPDPFSGRPGARLYRTGDMGRLHEGGVIEFLGRGDHQVKLRGHRIELGEIEEVLRSHPMVRHCVVILVRAGPDAMKLVAYLVCAVPFEETELRSWLRARLPDYMVPSELVVLPQIPVTANGKLDRAKLPNPFAPAHPTGSPEAPRTELERILLAVWSEVIGRQVSDVENDFFRLGGDSISAIRVVARSRARGLAFEVKDLFECPTIRRLANQVRWIKDAPLEPSPLERAWRAASTAQRAAAAPIGLYRTKSIAAVDIAGAIAQIAACISGRGVPAPQPKFRFQREDPSSIDALAAKLAVEIGEDVELVLSAVQMPGADHNEGTLVIAFDPARFDGASLAWVPELLADRSSGARFRWRFRTTCAPPDLEDAPAPIVPAVTSRRPQRSLQRVSAETRLPVSPFPLFGSPLANHRLDCLVERIIEAVVRAKGSGPLLVVAPEHRGDLRAKGYATATRIARLSTHRTVLCGGHDHGFCAATQGAKDSAPAQAIANSTADPAETLVLRITAPGPIPSAGTVEWIPSGHRLGIAAAVGFGDIGVVITDSQVWWSWDAALGPWPGVAASLLEQALSARDSEAAAAQLISAEDFPLSELSQTDFARLAPVLAQAEDVYPLTPLQEGLLLRTLYWPESDAYHNQNVLELVGPLDEAALAKAWQAVIERYEVLRAGYLWDGLQKPLQYIARLSASPFQQLDWSAMWPEGVESSLAAYLQKDREQPFDMTPGLFRLALAKLGPTKTLLIWTHHHILLDGWCLSLIWGDVFRYYAHFVTGEPGPSYSPRPFRDYIVWLKERTVSDMDRVFWRDNLKEFQTPTLFSRCEPDLEGEFATWRIPLTGAKTSDLKAAAAKGGVTPNALVQAAWALLLSLRSGREDVIHGVSVSGRPPELPGAEFMVGLFINTIPLRTRLKPGDTLAELARQVQQALALAGSKAHVPLSEILTQWTGRTTPNDRLFDSLIAFENYPEDNLPVTEVAGLKIRDRFCNEKTEYPFGLIVLPGPPMEFHFNFDQAHFSPAEVRDLIAEYFHLLEQFILKPGQRIEETSWMPAELEGRILSEWSRGRAARVGVEEDVLKLVWDTADLTPDRTALIAGEDTWSYARLHSVSRGVGRHVAQAEPRGPSVVILAERSPAYVAALLGAWYAGLVPVILNPSYPDDQLARVLAGMERPLLLASGRQAHRVREGLARVVDVEALVHTQWDQPGSNGPASHRLAAVLFTSGTTGKPKAVALTRAGLSNRIFATLHLYQTPIPRLFANAAPGFDISLWEILYPLCQGGVLILASNEEVRNPEAFCFQIERREISVLHAVPSLIGPLLACDQACKLRKLKLLVVGGETVSPQLVRRLTADLPSVRIWQGYGPTEATISVTDHLCSAVDGLARHVPLGRPTEGCQVYVLDPFLRLCPPGVEGMIYVGGNAVADGYVGHPRATAAAFIPDPFGPPGSRLYGTGDKGRWNRDGQLEFLGRADRQVKVRGHRVELVAVEDRLSAHPLVQRALVAVRPEPNGDSRLVAFVMPTGPFPQAPAELGDLLRHWVSASLPPWAVPSSVEIVAEWPLSGTGKADLAKLLQDSAPRSSARHTAPAGESPMEHHLREAWTDALGSEPPNRHASFFDCGGHSLSAMRFALSLKRRLHLSQVPAPLVFKYPTLAGLGEALLSPLEGSGLRFTSVIKRGHRTPLILVHPVQGISQAYRALAGHLHDRTIITIDSPRMGQPSGFRSLQEMAALYVEWARSLTDDKPVILGGWSFGGAVALEMGLILARHGTAPAGLVLIDSFNFTGKSALAGKLTAAAEATLSNLEAVDRVTREVVQQEIRHNTFLAFGASSDRFDKPCLLIQARGGEPGANLEPENGWRRDQLPRLRVVPAASDHHNILSPEFVAETAGMLDSFMSEMD